ncbi:type B 50S ribosomal protein L36 [Saccharopolyspora indica]|uniref:Large ribosomal subunit protein bL36 n=2 Tax=Saccharopolyspora TaxID=1835 RepID=A0A1I4TT28_9PSEU|nr:MULTISPECIES: type B 50S ribosomal protein L36 [Saccharopolyspora]MDA3645705.1 type B 50S ribosomal protein L36 [Saccharopolyspora indica]RKT88537.1 LSU ribosomal protein L36P [Saccharopolyspora antimicrobica]SEG15912.1 LSU ribosomal protein L36P [Saccharopolyspora kobensis]SFF10788.1 LSU ribosomal protein L36P [Saccharopolyspora kobensis]SFM79735.1 large subunit ribosomal protein L36 [Saccharopolyspora antimicrobica]
MKVRASIKSLKNKEGSQVVRRRGKLYVVNKRNPRWKARQG